MSVIGTTLVARDYKCFGATEEGLLEIRDVTVIVGRNNSGKSTLLDLLEAARTGSAGLGRKPGSSRPSEIFIKSRFSEDDYQRFFMQTEGNFIRTNVVDERIIGGTVEVKYSSEIGQTTRLIPPVNSGLNEDDIKRAAPDAVNQLLSLHQRCNPFLNKQYFRMQADRDIRPEREKNTELQIDGAGAGLTNVIQRYLNEVSLDSALIEVTLLTALNKVFSPDAAFKRISAQRSGDSWEIFLEEEHKGAIALSQSGSGIKTVILALAFVHLLPVIRGGKPSDYMMAFEELENNLHPALQRRLIAYLCDAGKSLGFPIFFSTHSTIAIDLLNTFPSSAIIHVTHDGIKAKCSEVRAYVEHHGVLDDLDVRASDLLQANCIIWVEGPSDRIYINRWIRLWSNDSLAEGKHYQIVFYGGRLLSHLEASDPTQPLDGISILRVNRNACIVMDSDKRTNSDGINATKQRIIQEIEAIGGLSWVTLGKEIENYVPRGVFETWLPVLRKTKKWPTQFGDVLEWISQRQKYFHRVYGQKKPELAEELCKHMNRPATASCLDLDERMTELCARIKHWNKIKEPQPPEPEPEPEPYR